MGGIREIMELVEVCLPLEYHEIIRELTKMLANIFCYAEGIDAIKRKQKNYYEMFFELSTIDVYIKK